MGTTATGGEQPGRAGPGGGEVGQPGRRVQRAVAGFNPHWKFEPMGAEVGGGAIENLVDGLSLRVWTARRLGLVSSVRVFRLALAYGVPVFGVGTLGTRPVPPPRPGEEVRVTAETALRINPGIRWAITERDDHIDLVFRDRVVELPLLTYHTVALLSQLSKRIFTPRELRGDLDVTSRAILAQVFVNGRTPYHCPGVERRVTNPYSYAAITS